MVALVGTLWKSKTIKSPLEFLVLNSYQSLDPQGTCSGSILTFAHSVLGIICCCAWGVDVNCSNLPRFYRHHPQMNLEFLRKLLVLGLGYVPGVCWRTLRRTVVFRCMHPNSEAPTQSFEGCQNTWLTYEMTPPLETQLWLWLSETNMLFFTMFRDLTFSSMN